MFATAKSDLADTQFIRLRESFAHDAKFLGVDVIFGYHEIGSLKEIWRQLLRLDELFDLHRGCGRQAKRFQFLRVYLDVSVFGILKAFDDICLFNFSCIVDILMMHPLVRLAINQMKFNLAGRVSSGEDLDRDRNE
jgi:hypothetical protein